MDPQTRKRVLEQLSSRTTSGTRKVPLYQLESEERQLYKVLESTVKYREGKSVLLVGPRAVGKTTMINNCLLELQQKYDGQFLVIRISGLFEHDDKSAVREIARQLDLMADNDEDDLEDGDDEYVHRAGFEKLSSNATMHAIMGILDRSRLEEDSKATDEQIPLIFVIDEIDRYTTNARQTLLYNLFDIAQSSSKETGSTLTIIGVTTRTTVREQLEKRVKSRFSQRVIQISKRRSVDDFCECVRTMLSVEGDESWNQKVKDLLQTRGSQLRKMVVSNFYTVKDLNLVKNSLVPLVASGLAEVPAVEDNSLDAYRVMDTLSELELKLLVCSARVKAKSGVDKVNFNVVFDEYRELAKKQRTALRSQMETMGVSLRGEGYETSRNLLLSCWERLADLGVMGDAMKQINGVSATSYTGGEFNKVYICDVQLDELMKHFKHVAWVEPWCRIA